MARRSKLPFCGNDRRKPCNCAMCFVVTEFAYVDINIVFNLFNRMSVNILPLFISISENRGSIYADH